MRLSVLYLCVCVCLLAWVITWHLNQESGFYTRPKWISALNYIVYCLHRFSLRYELKHTHTHTHQHNGFLCVTLSEQSLCAYLLFWEEHSCHGFILETQKRSCAFDVTDITYWLHTRQALWHSLIHTKKDTIVVSGSPSIVRPSSPPWLYTGTPLTWQRQSCQNWWCRRLGPPIPFCTLFHCLYSVDHKLHQVRTVLAFL